MDFVWITQEHAQEVRSKVRSKQGEWEEVAFELRRWGEAAMSQGPWSVTWSSKRAPSGDPHDYLSEAPYFWPDPEHPEGPYIRRDGLVYPGRFNEHRKGLSDLGKTVLALASAGYYLEEEAYLDRAAYLLDVWFNDEATRMNPHMRNGQAIYGICEGRCIGIIELEDADKVVHSLGFLSENKKYAGTVAGVKRWMNEMLDWLLEPDGFGWQECHNGNNHAAWCIAHMMLFAALNDREDVVRSLVPLYKEEILPQIEADGSLPRELTRTRSFHYSLFGLNPMVVICEMAGRYGMDLWELENEKGGSLRKAAEYMLPAMENPFTWKYPQIIDEKTDDSFFYQYAAQRLGEPRYAQVNRHRREGYRYIRMQEPFGPLCLLEGTFEF